MAENTKKEIFTEDEIFLSYFAGAIDSDGHITVTRSSRKVGKRYSHHPTYYHARIGFTSTEKVVPELFMERLGGSISTHTPKNKNHKKIYIWSVGTADAGRVASLLLPFLKLKAEQAKLIIKLCEIVDTQHKEQKETQKPPYKITPTQLSIREGVWIEVTKLNKPRNRRVHYGA